MNNTLRRIAVIVAVVAGAGLVLFVGSNVLARGNGPLTSGPFGWSNMMGRNGNNQAAASWMGGMMGYTQSMPYNGGGMMDGRGMMSSGASMMNGGMMGYSGTLPTGMGAMMGLGSATSAKPLSIEQVTNAVNDYLSKLGNDDLALAEVMIFDNNAYARITEKSAGVGAFELLVDPATLSVYPEPGPNMMWNIKYGHMRGGMMGGMMSSTVPQATTAMPVSPADALSAAQTYLDQNLPGTKTAADAEAFYGYYTIDTLRGGKVVGMLSVNGYTGQVFVHIWHGNFVEMSEGGQ